MGRFQRGYKLMKASWQVLKHEKALIFAPILSFISSILILVTFAYPAYLLVHDLSPGIFNQPANEPLTSQQSILVHSLLFIYYVLNFFIVYFFNSVIIACAKKLLAGEPVNIRYGLKVAYQRKWLILKWAFVSATVGLILKLIEDRFKFVGQIIAGLLGAAFSIISFVVLPAIIVENIGLKQALQQSAKTLKKTWGESFAGFAGLGIITFLFQLPFIALLMFAISYFDSQAIGLSVSLIVIAILGFILVGVVQTTLTTIFRTAIYQYSVSGNKVNGFEPELLQSCIKLKDPNARSSTIWRR